MSSSLYWRPVSPSIPDNQLSTDLKFKIRDHLWGGDPEWNNGHVLKVTDAVTVGYLAGLADCGVEDAQKLIDLVRKHRQVELWIGDDDGPR